MCYHLSCESSYFSLCVLGWCVQSLFESSTVTLQLHVLGNKMMFFINGSDVAEALKEIDGKTSIRKWDH